MSINKRKQEDIVFQGCCKIAGVNSSTCQYGKYLKQRGLAYQQKEDVEFMIDMFQAKCLKQKGLQISLKKKGFD